MSKMGEYHSSRTTWHDVIGKHCRIFSEIFWRRFACTHSASYRYVSYLNETHTFDALVFEICNSASMAKEKEQSMIDVSSGYSFSLFLLINSLIRCRTLHLRLTIFTREAGEVCKRDGCRKQRKCWRI
ncbi:hypothetical protein Bca4012_021107 [Brassica carinata]